MAASSSIILWLLSWVGFLFSAVFATLCLAAGLYYLAEMVEEYSVMTKKVLQATVLVCLGLHIILGVSGATPLLVTALGVGAHITYRMLLSDFPFFDLASFAFVGSLVLFLAHNYYSFGYFTSGWFPFDQVYSYFVVGVWLVPFMLFISLSANENVLPTQASGVAPPSGGHRNRRQGGLLGILSFVRTKTDEILPVGTKKA